MIEQTHKSGYSEVPVTIGSAANRQPSSDSQPIYPPDDTALRIGRMAIEHHGTALLGISLMNSWFRDDQNLAGLLKWASKKFQRVELFVPDIFAEHNFAALGYNSKESATRARLQGNNLANHCERLISQFDLRGSAVIERINLQDILKTRAEFQIARNWIYDLYMTRDEFRMEARSITKDFLEGKPVRDDLNFEQRIDQAVQFLLDELSFFACACQLYQTPNCVYVYHRDMPIYRELVNGRFGEPPALISSMPGFMLSGTEVD